MWYLTLAAFLQPIYRISGVFLLLVWLNRWREMKWSYALLAILCSCSDEFDCSGLSAWLQSKVVL